MADRKTVACSECGAEVGEPCVWDVEPEQVVDVDGERRRAVHAARYAQTLPESERAAFWEAAVEQYITRALTAIGEGGEG